MESVSLDSLAAETFANITEYLDLADLRCLRLTSSTICHLATQDKFKQSCQEKQVLLTEIGLQSFLHIVRTSRLFAGALRTLTLVHPLDEDARRPWGRLMSRKLAEARISAEDKRELQEEGLARYRQWSAAPQDPALFHGHGPFVRMLAEAFGHVKSSRPAYQLACLRLKIAKPAPFDPYEDEDYDALGDFREDAEFFGPATGVYKTFKLAITALQASQLPVGQLDLFPQGGYALGWDVLSEEGKLIHEDQLRKSFAPLRQLTLRFSEPVSHGFFGPPPHLVDDVVCARNEIYGAALRRSLLLPQALQSLDMTFVTQRPKGRDPAPTTALFYDLGGTQPPRFHELRKLRLSTMVMAETDLYDLLEGCCATLTRLFLHDIKLHTTDSIARLFCFCTNSAVALEQLVLENLRDAEEQGRVMFVGTFETVSDGSWRAENACYPNKDNRRAGEKLRRSGAEVRDPIEWDWLGRGSYHPLE